MCTRSSRQRARRDSLKKKKENLSSNGIGGSILERVNFSSSRVAHFSAEKRDSIVSLKRHPPRLKRQTAGGERGGIETLRIPSRTGRFPPGKLNLASFPYLRINRRFTDVLQLSVLHLSLTLSLFSPRKHLRFGER